MTYAVTRIGNKEIVGRLKQVRARLDITSYTASGEVLTATDFGFSRINNVEVVGVSDNGHIMRWDPVNSKVRAYKMNTGGIITESLPDVKGAVFASITSDAAAAALNDATVVALTDATVTTAGGLAHLAGKSTGLTNPNTLDAEVVARNVVVVQNQNGAGGTWTAGWCRITGTDQFGVAQVEDIALQTDAIADTKFRLTVGTKAFATVTNVVLLDSAKTAGQAGPASSRLSVGIGTIFGLRGKITAESDIKSVRKDGAAIAAATYVGTASPSQVDMGANVADDVDIVIEYDAVASSLIDREAATTVDVGEVVVVVSGK